MVRVGKDTICGRSNSGHERISKGFGSKTLNLIGCFEGRGEERERTTAEVSAAKRGKTLDSERERRERERRVLIHPKLVTQLDC